VTGAALPGPGRDRQDDGVRRDVAAALRVTVVAALLLLAALGTAGRRGLSWRDLLVAPRDSLAASALVLVGAVVVAGMVRGVVEAWRRRRRQHRKRPWDGEDDRSAEEIEVGRRAMVTAAVVAFGLALLVAVLAGLWVSRQNGRLHTVNEGPDSTGGARAPVSPTFAAVLAAAAVLLLTTFVLSYLARRAREQAARPRRADGTSSTAAADAVVADAATAAQETLASHDDVRGGIIAAYEAMVDVLGRRGAPRSPADTAEDLLARALQASSVPPAEGRELTSLFHEARFSSHPMGRPERSRAEAALRAVVSSTGGERVGVDG
jgi:MFS family permease